MTTDDLLTALYDLDESPSAELRGKPLNARGLARRLTRYEVKSRTIRIGEKVAKGYRREDLYDAWVRYLPNVGQTKPQGEGRRQDSKLCRSPTTTALHPLHPTQRGAPHDHAHRPRAFVDRFRAVLGNDACARGP